MAETKNLKLYVTPSDDTTTPLKDWVQKVAGETESNMTIIDDKYKKLEDDIAGVSEQVGDQLQEQLSGIVSRVEAEEFATAEMKDAIRQEIEADRDKAINDAITVEVSNRNTAIAAAIFDEVVARNQAIDDATKTLKTEVEENIQPAISDLQSVDDTHDTAIKQLQDDCKDLQDELANLPSGNSGVNFDELYFDAETNELHIRAGGADVVSPVVIPSGGTAATGIETRLYDPTGASSVVVGLGSDWIANYYFYSFNNDANQSTGSGSATFLLDGSQIHVNDNIIQGDNTYTIESTLLTEGTHTLVLRVSNKQGTVRSLSWSITVKAVSVSCDIDDTGYFTGEVPVKYIPIGSGIAKKTIFELDGKEIYSATTSDSNISKSYRVPAQSHGSHVLRVWTEATINGHFIKSDVLTYGMVWVEDGNDDVIISIKGFGAFRQFTTTLIPYFVYDPANENATVVRSIDGVDLPEIVVGREIQEWYYTPTTSGVQHLTIACGNKSEEFEIVVEDSGVDIEEVTDGLVWKFNPAGRSNSEVNRAEWSNGDVTLDIPDDFRWTRGGWGVDEDGYPCFTVPAGNTVAFNANLFGSDWKANGHAFKIIFKTANVCNYDAKVASCLSDNGIGFEITAQTATFKTLYETVSIPLCEDKYTELDWNVTSTGNLSEIITWLQGIPSGVITYGSTDSFIQHPVVPITIGSPECDVRIYGMREYDSYLNDDEVFNNWVVDAPTGAEMYDRYVRNQVIGDNGELDPNTLAELHPELRVIMLTCDRLATGKESADWVTGCTVQHIMTKDKKKHCWTATNVRHRLQGTSSIGYAPYSAGNLDFDFGDTQFVFEDADLYEEKTKSDVYAMTDNSIGVNYFNLKVNVASSENANNACLTSEYQRFNPYLRDARKNDPRVRDTMEFHPCVLFVKDLSGNLFGDDQFHFYAAGDFGNSKKNSEAQGLDSNNEHECIVELMDNNPAVCKWKTTEFAYDMWGDDTVDFRFNNDVADENTLKDSFHRVLFWVASTDTTAATGNMLAEAVEYDGVTYEVDNAAYRLAKFRNEFDDYFVSDSVMFYYLFTERHTMVDNRAKNTFWHTSDGLHWDLCFDYDNDTSMGINNVGALTLTYGLEDIDKIGDNPVFNASDSVFFCNVRDCFRDRLQQMYRNLENSDDNLSAWSSKRLLREIEEYQAIKPERVWIADMRRKYLRVAENYDPETAAEYLAKMHGTKVLQRAQFETYQEPYCASKYLSANCRGDSIMVRVNQVGDGSEQTVSLTVTMYCDCYLNVMFVKHEEQRRVKRGVPVTLSYEVQTYEDAETFIYLASKVQALGDMSAMKFGSCEFQNAEKLQSLVVSPYDENYSNVNLKNLTISNCKLLKELIVCGCPNLTGNAPVGNLPLLERVDLRGTGISGVAFAKGGYLQSAKLPAGVIGLTAIDLHDFEELTMEGTSALTKLQVESCEKLKSTTSSAGQLLTIVESAINNLEGVRLIGVDWLMSRSSLLVKLGDLAGIDNDYNLSGTASITGKVHVAGMSQSRYEFLTERYPDLEITYGSTLTDYTVRFINTDDGETILETQLIEAGSDAEDPTKRGDGWKPTKPQTAWIVYEFDEWDKGFTVVNSDLDIYALYTERPATYTVTWTDGTYIIGEPDIVEAGGSVVYSGPVLTLDNHVWTGFDGVAENVLEDLTLTATFTELKQPSKPDFETDIREFLYSDKDIDSSYYDLGEFMWIINSGEMNDYFYDYGKIKLVHKSNEVNADDKEIVLSLHSKDGHFRLSDGSALAKTTWFMNGVLIDPMAMDITAPYSNSGGYFASHIDNWLENTLYPALPYHWKAIIKPVVVLANEGGMEVGSGIRHLYIPSAAELVSSMNYVPYRNEVDSDVEYATFSSYNSPDQRIKRFYNGVGQPAYYWTRSAVSTDNTDFWLMADNGYAIEYPSQFTYCVCFGFSI